VKDDAAQRNARLPLAQAEREWEAFLSERLDTEVEVRFGRARREVIQLRRSRRRVTLRLASIFTDAPLAVREALADWVHGDRRAAQRALDVWIDERLRAEALANPARIQLEARGKHHDLGQLADELVRAEFSAAFATSGPPRVGWGRAGKSRSRRSLRLGSFDPFTRAARIHPVLDSADVPRFFVRYLLFHELLHAALDAPRESAGRKLVHGPEFRARERIYADYARSLAWEKQHIRALISSARAGRGFSAEPRRRSPAKALLQRLLF